MKNESERPGWASWANAGQAGTPTPPCKRRGPFVSLMGRVSQLRRISFGEGGLADAAPFMGGRPPRALPANPCAARFVRFGRAGGRRSQTDRMDRTHRTHRTYRTHRTHRTHPRQSRLTPDTPPARCACQPRGCATTSSAPRFFRGSLHGVPAIGVRIVCEGARAGSPRRAGQTAGPTGSQGHCPQVRNSRRNHPRLGPCGKGTPAARLGKSGRWGFWQPAPTACGVCRIAFMKKSTCLRGR
jgi:hypothetical protein